MIINCLECRKDYKTYKPSQIYCSNKCANLASKKRIEKVCQTCKKAFEVRVCEITRKFCSKNCYDLNRASVKISKICMSCRKSFGVFPFEFEKRKFCSKKCDGIGRNSEIEKKCLNCEIFFKTPNCANERTKYCSVECRYKYVVRNRITKLCLNCELHFTVAPSHGDKKYCSVVCYRASAAKNETDIEKKLRLVLESANISHEKQYQIGRHFVDFAITSNFLAVEADGEYWHNKEKDEKRDAIITSLGWRVLRFTGTEIKKNPKNCLAKIQEALC